MSSPVSDPHVVLRWLGSVRLSLVAAAISMGALSRLGVVDPLPLPPIAAAFALLVLLDTAEREISARRRDLSERLVSVHIAIDLLVLSGLVAVSSGGHQPLQVFFVIESVVAAAALSRTRAMGWALTATAMLTAAAVGPALLEGDPEVGHLAAHAALFGFATLMTTWFVTHLSAALRANEAALRQSETDRADAQRLASLGALAAGVAHELATPLGSIGVMADEVLIAGVSEADRARSVATLRDELERCRDLLVRLKAGGDVVGGTTARIGDQIDAWISQWSTAHRLAVNAQIDPDLCELAVRGDDARWRGALWTALDNARAAGTTDVQVTARRASAGQLAAVLVDVEDRGCGLDAMTAIRAGEPFYTAWTSGTGRGLGLYVARTFARAVGGDVALDAREGGGARLRLLMPVEA